MSDVTDLPLIGAAALRARAAARVLRTLPTDTKDAALTAMADALVERTDEILTANAADVDAAAAAGLCLKSGNAVLLRGSASAYRSNRVLVDVYISSSSLT